MFLFLDVFATMNAGPWPKKKPFIAKPADQESLRKTPMPVVLFSVNAWVMIARFARSADGKVGRFEGKE
jgi:hypothetical protein